MRNIALVICCLALVLVGYKLIRVADKIYYYNEGVAYLENKDLMSAEENLMRTYKNRWINYKETEVTSHLDQLKPVTEMKSLLTTLSDDVKRYSKNNALDKLLLVHTNYQQAKVDYAKEDAEIAALFQRMSGELQLDKELNEALVKIKEDILQTAEASIKNLTFEEDNYITEFAALPADLFGDQKKKDKEVRALFEKYDKAKLGYWAKHKSLPEYLKATADLWSIYQTKEIKASWLIPIAEQHTQTELTVLIEKDELSTLTQFIEYAKLAESNKSWIGSKSKLYSFITKQVNAAFKKADGLVKSKEYAEAIELYTVLGTYKDAKDQIQAAETAWLQNDPSRLLSTALPGQTFTNVIGQKGKKDTLFEAAGIHGNTLTYARMMSDKQVVKSETTLDENWKVREIQFASEYSGQGLPALLVEGDSSNRKKRTLIFELEDTQLNQILVLDADSIKLDRKGVIIANNATGEGSDKESYYEYTSGVYVFTKVKTDFIDILLDQLEKYTKTKVRFQADVASVEGSTALVPYLDTYILLSGNFDFNLGPQTIIGTWVGKEDIVVNSELISAYKVNVAEIQPAENTE